MASGQEAAVAAAVESLRKAMIAGDKATLDKLTMAELSYGHASARLETKAQFIDALVSGKGGYSAAELTDQTIKMIDKMAIVRHTFTGTRRDNGGVMKLMNLQIWLQQPDQQWKLVARQAVRP